MKSLREQDNKLESYFRKFMDTHFYSKCPLITSFKREYSYSKQVKGIDLYLSIPSKGINNVKVDEKAAVRFFNKDLQTFAFELEFTGRTGIVQKGWFIDDSLESEYYMLEYGSGNTDSLNSIEDIQSIEVILINKNRLKQELNKQVSIKSYNYAIELLRDDMLNVRSFNAENFKFVRSNQLAERPINIIIPKKFLIDISDLHMFINNK